MGQTLPFVLRLRQSERDHRRVGTYAKPDIARAKQLLAESGYKGEPVTLVTSHETLFIGMAADYVTEALKKSDSTSRRKTATTARS